MRARLRLTGFFSLLVIGLVTAANQAEVQRLPYLPAEFVGSPDQFSMLAAGVWDLSQVDHEEGQLNDQEKPNIIDINEVEFSISNADECIKRPQETIQYVQQMPPSLVHQFRIPRGQPTERTVQLFSKTAGWYPQMLISRLDSNTAKWVPLQALSNSPNTRYRFQTGETYVLEVGSSKNPSVEQITSLAPEMVEQKVEGQFLVLFAHDQKDLLAPFKDRLFTGTDAKIPRVMYECKLEWGGKAYGVVENQREDWGTFDNSLVPCYLPETNALRMFYSNGQESADPMEQGRRYRFALELVYTNDAVRSFQGQCYKCPIESALRILSCKNGSLPDCFRRLNRAEKKCNGQRMAKQKAQNAAKSNKNGCDPPNGSNGGKSSDKNKGKPDGKKGGKPDSKNGGKPDGKNGGKSDGKKGEKASGNKGGKSGSNNGKISKGKSTDGNSPTDKLTTENYKAKNAKDNVKKAANMNAKNAQKPSFKRTSKAALKANSAINKMKQKATKRLNKPSTKANHKYTPMDNGGGNYGFGNALSPNYGAWNASNYPTNEDYTVVDAGSGLARGSRNNPTDLWGQIPGTPQNSYPHHPHNTTADSQYYNAAAYDSDEDRSNSTDVFYPESNRNSSRGKQPSNNSHYSERHNPNYGSHYSGHNPTDESHDSSSHNPNYGNNYSSSHNPNYGNHYSSSHNPNYGNHYSSNRDPNYANLRPFNTSPFSGAHHVNPMLNNNYTNRKNGMFNRNALNSFRGVSRTEKVFPYPAIPPKNYKCSNFPRHTFLHVSDLYGHNVQAKHPVRHTNNLAHPQHNTTHIPQQRETDNDFEDNVEHQQNTSSDGENSSTDIVYPGAQDEHATSDEDSNRHSTHSEEISRPSQPIASDDLNADSSSEHLHPDLLQFAEGLGDDAGEGHGESVSYPPEANSNSMDISGNSSSTTEHDSEHHLEVETHFDDGDNNKELPDSFDSLMFQTPPEPQGLKSKIKAVVRFGRKKKSDK